eukprot:jgi/Bigna1/131118/aug1.13_g5826
MCNSPINLAADSMDKKWARAKKKKARKKSKKSSSSMAKTDAKFIEHATNAGSHSWGTPSDSDQMKAESIMNAVRLLRTISHKDNIPEETRKELSKACDQLLIYSASVSGNVKEELVRAVKGGASVSLIEELFEKKNAPSVNDLVCKGPLGDSRTLLAEAINALPDSATGVAEIIRYLIEVKHANVNKCLAEKGYGRPIAIAAGKFAVDTVEYLLDKNARLDVNGLSSALCVTLCQSSTEFESKEMRRTVSCLLEARADPLWRVGEEVEGGGKQPPDNNDAGTGLLLSTNLGYPLLT